MCKERVTFCSSVTALNFLISLPTLKSQECKTSQSNRHLAAFNLINFLFKTIFLNSQSSNPSTFSTFTVLGREGPSGVLWEPSSVPGPCRSLSDGAPVHQVILCTAPQPGHPASVWGSALVLEPWVSASGPTSALTFICFHPVVQLLGSYLISALGSSCVLTFQEHPRSSMSQLLKALGATRQPGETQEPGDTWQVKLTP